MKKVFPKNSECFVFLQTNQEWWLSTSLISSISSLPKKENAVQFYSQIQDIQYKFVLTNVKIFHRQVQWVEITSLIIIIIFFLKMYVTILWEKTNER